MDLFPNSGPNTISAAVPQIRAVPAARQRLAHHAGEVVRVGFLYKQCAAKATASATTCKIGMVAVVDDLSRSP